MLSNFALNCNLRRYTEVFLARHADAKLGVVQFANDLVGGDAGCI